MPAVKSKRGGHGAGGGKKGAKLKPKPSKILTQQAKEQSAYTGELPHEWLARVARGDTIRQKRLVIVYYNSGPKKGEEKERVYIEEDYQPSFSERSEAARAAAPFFAPRLATQTVKTDDKTTEALTQAFHALAGRLPV